MIHVTSRKREELVVSIHVRQLLLWAQIGLM